MNLQQEFLAFAHACGVLRFGEFTTKAGRQSPYFFNTGLFQTGAQMVLLADCYAQALLVAQASGRLGQVDMLFGPAYKGIPLVTATAMACAQRGMDLPMAYNRKEKKDHGEGGVLVGAPLDGRVLILDDVISAGTSVGESVELIRAAGAEPAGVLIALDRQERGADGSALSAVQQVEQRYGMPVVAVATLDSLMSLMAETDDPEIQKYAGAVAAYREQWGVGG